MKQFSNRPSALRRLTALALVCALLTLPVGALRVEDARTLLEEYYVDALPPAAAEAETLDELFDAVGDPYTYYMTAVEYADFLAGVEGDSSVTGIGAGIAYTDEGILITSVLPGGGAEEVGMLPGDLIVRIDGVPCVPADESHRAALVGEAGTRVTVTVKREGETLRFTIERREVVIRNTTVSFRDGVTTLACESFGSQTSSYFEQAIDTYGAQTRLYTVDLRGNSGGMTSAAIGSVGLFLGGGEPLLYYRTKAGTVLYDSYVGDASAAKPLLILLDGYTASASEIFASDVRAADAGISIGSRTFGKGVAQIVLDEETSDLFDGDALKLTAYRFYTADGCTTDRIGTIPTLLLPDEFVDEAAALLSAAEPTANTTGWYRLTLCSQRYYIAPSENEADADARARLFAALPPDAHVAVGTGIGWEPIDVPFAQKLTGAERYARGAFSDLDGLDCANAVRTLAVYDILRGCGDGTYRPEDTLTRAELCAILARTLNVTAIGESAFTDVPERAWYASDVNAMEALGLVNGFGDGTFRPDDPVTQEQMLVIFGRLAAFVDLATYFADAKWDASAEPDSALSPWAQRGIAALSATGTAFAMPASPDTPASRGGAAQTLCALLRTLDVLAY